MAESTVRRAQAISTLVRAPRSDGSGPTRRSLRSLFPGCRRSWHSRRFGLRAAKRATTTLRSGKRLGHAEMAWLMAHLPDLRLPLIGRTLSRFCLACSVLTSPASRTGADMEN